MIDEKRLVEVFRLEYEATRDLPAAVRAVATAALSSTTEDAPPLDEADCDAWKCKSRGVCQDPEESQVADVMRAVGQRFGIGKKRLLIDGRRRSRDGSQIRRIAMALLRRLGLSLPKIAAAMGLANHTSVLDALRRLNADPVACAAVESLWRALVDKWGSAPVRSSTGYRHINKALSSVPAKACAEQSVRRSQCPQVGLSGGNKEAA